MANTVYRGPGKRDPVTITDRTVSGALLPCTAVFVGLGSFTQATSATGGRLALLGIPDYYSPSSMAFNNTDPRKAAYTSGDGGLAYVLEVGQVYQWAMAAGSYTRGQELTVGASGRLTAASAGNIVVAYFDELNVTVGAGDLMDVVIAPFYTK